MFEIFLYASIAVAVLLSAIYYFFCARELGKLTAEFKNVVDAQDVAAALKNSEVLAPAWKNFCKSLTEADGKTYSTTDAAEFFSPQSLTQGLNMSFWQGYGGIFTGLGILGTFGGLTLGLSGIDMTSGDIELLKAGIAKLLAGVESAFVTSLVGISCAIVYGFVHHRLLRNFRGNLRRMNDRLDEIYPRRNAEDWLGKICAGVDNLNAGLNVGFDSLSAGIGKINSGVDSLNTGLNAGFDKLSAGIGKINSGVENLNAGGTEALGEVFSERVGSQMDKFSAALEEFSAVIKNSATQRQLANENFYATLKGLTDSFSAVVDKLNAQQDVSAANFNTLTEKLIETLQREAENFSATLKQLTEDFSAVADKFKSQQDVSAANFSAVTDKFKTQQENSVANFNMLTKQLIATLQRETENSTAKVSATLNGLIRNFDTLTAQLGKTLQRGTENSAAQISGAVNGFRNIIDTHKDAIQKTFDRVQELLNATEKFLRNVNEAGYSLKQAAEPVRQSAEQLNRGLNNFTVANQATRQNLAELTAQLNTLTKNFNGLADEFARTVEIIRATLDNYNAATNAALIEKLAEFDESMTQAFGYLQELTEDLGDTLADFKRRR